MQCDTKITFNVIRIDFFVCEGLIVIFRYAYIRKSND